MSTQNKTTLPLMRTVNKVKSTTTGLRGFADSVDHLLNAVEEFFPLIEKAAAKQNQWGVHFAPRGNHRRRHR